jgi:hypothetical protein
VRCVRGNFDEAIRVVPFRVTSVPDSTVLTAAFLSVQSQAQAADAFEIHNFGIR